MSEKRQERIKKQKKNRQQNTLKALSLARRKMDRAMDKVEEACDRAVDRLVDIYKVSPVHAAAMLAGIIDKHVGVAEPAPGNEPEPVVAYSGAGGRPAGGNAAPVLEKKPGFDKGAWGRPQ